MNNSIWIGFDPREAAAFAVAKYTIKKHLTQPVPIRGLVLDDLQKRGLYYRPTELRPAAADRPILWDVISDAPMSTEFACSRFLVPHLAKKGWAVFLDCDMLIRANIIRLIESLDPKYAVYCVKHDYRPATSIKMDGVPQLSYNRKLWSSFCVFNVDHASNRALTVEYINSVPGRDLHAFAWLKDEEIGEIDERWNWIPGHSPNTIDPCCVHFSEGGPWFPGYDNVEFADEWRRELVSWAV